jgi:hypothetical protein
MCRPSSLTSCHSPGAISALGCNLAPVPPVFMVRRRTHRDGADAVAAAFGLTPPAQTRLLANLFCGRTLTETAATLGITRPTTKTYLHALGRADASVDGVDLHGGIGPVR